KGNLLRLKLEDHHPCRLRRLTDRPTIYLIKLTIDEQHAKNPQDNLLVRTSIYLEITTEKLRNRRQNDNLQRVHELFASLRAYLMAHEEDSHNAHGVWVRVGRMLFPWLVRK
ncbi:MAG: hypothetical protein ACWGMZ_04810, partial [Thermoguttaceae bacterium]